MTSPLCFVLMPCGQKPTAAGAIVDFDVVYHDLIAPAIAAAGLQPLRADEEMTGGLIHKPMYERLILCEYAVADLTTANAHVFYELGLRHAVRPASTVLIFAAGIGQLPFDVAPLRAIPYEIDTDGKPVNTVMLQETLVGRLRESRDTVSDRPVFDLVEAFPDIQRLKTDVFRDWVYYSGEIKQQLATARQQGVAAVRTVERQLGNIAAAEAGVVIDLLLSYRAVQAWQDMIDLVPKMSLPLAQSMLVQEQLGLALNRAGKGEEAERLLIDLIARRGLNSETCSILGRVYKDRWEKAHKAGDKPLARELLDKAINAYLKGFEADWRDAYPGINAVTLMELRDSPDPRREKLLPVVAYAIERRIAAGQPDYWDYATRLELAVLARDEQTALNALANALAAVRERWEPETTAHNLRLIREARERRGETVAWAKDIEEALNLRV